jgi:hypothetical protein
MAAMMVSKAAQARFRAELAMGIKRPKLTLATSIRS